jgi:hypothetical protein
MRTACAPYRDLKVNRVTTEVLLLSQYSTRNRADATEFFGTLYSIVTKHLAAFSPSCRITEWVGPLDSPTPCAETVTWKPGTYFGGFAWAIEIAWFLSVTWASILSPVLKVPPSSLVV